MATVSSTFGAAGVSSSLRTGKKGENITVALSGTYAAAVQLERATSPDELSWEKVLPVDQWKTDDATVSEVYLTQRDNEVLRLRATSYTSGTVTYSISDGARVIQIFVDDNGVELFSLTEDGIQFGGTLTVAGISTFTGAITASGGVVGNVTGNASGTAATVTGATQAAITTAANLVTVGALASGSIASGFGTIATGNTITTTAAITGGNIQCTDNIGAAGTGVTAVEYGDGYNHVTVLTLTAAALTPTIPADAEGAGAIIYTFPAGVYAGHMAHLDLTAATVDSATNAAEVSLGSVIASGDVTDTSTPATFEDWIEGQTIANVSSPATEKTTIMTAGVPLVFEAAGSHVLHINMAGTWNSTVSTLDATGTVTIFWTFLGA